MPIIIHNKCYAVVAPEETVKDLKTIVEKLTAYIKEYPIFTLILSDKSINNKMDIEKLNSESILVQASSSAPVLRLFCPSINHTNSVKLLWSEMKNTTFHEVCSMKKENIKIAYNTDLPFFNLKDGMPDMETIEAILIETFLEKHNLSATWDDAGGSWGSRGQNGTFNGVVGKVETFQLLP